MSAAEFDTSQLEPKEVAEVITIDDDPEFQRFIETNPVGLAIVPKRWRDYPEPVLPPDAGDFAKWLRANAPVSVKVIETDKRLVLHSAEFWLPLVFLASDVSVQVYLNMVASYLYDKLKGALKGDAAPRVHLSAEYVETPDGRVIKRFNFDGDLDTLKKVTKRFDLNKFLDD